MVTEWGDGAADRVSGVAGRTEPVDAEPVDAEPVETPPVQAGPVEARPSEAAPVEAEPLEARPVEARPVESRPVESRPVEAGLVEAGPVEAGPIESGAAQPASVPEPPSPAPWSRVWPPWTYWVRTTLAVVLTLLVVAAARRISHVLVLALVAFVLAVGLEPAVQWLGRQRVRRGWAVAIIFGGMALFLAVFVALLVPLLAREVPQLAGALPGYVADLQRRDDWLGNAFRHANVSEGVRQFIADLPRKVGGSFTAIVGAAGTAFALIFDAFTVGILCIYFMVALPRLPATIATLTSPDRRAHLDLLLRRSFDKIGGYVSGNLITSAVCGAMTVAALLVLRVDYAVPLGLWAGVADLIPQVGAYLGALPAVLVALTHGPAYGVATVLFFIAYQQFENYVLAPRVYKSSIDLSPAAVIISTLAGGILAGFAGALLALPVAATIKVIAVDFVLASRSSPRPGDGTAAGPPASTGT